MDPPIRLSRLAVCRGHPPPAPDTAARRPRLPPRLLKPRGARRGAASAGRRAHPSVSVLGRWAASTTSTRSRAARTGSPPSSSPAPAPASAAEARGAGAPRMWPVCPSLAEGAAAADQHAPFTILRVGVRLGEVSLYPGNRTGSSFKREYTLFGHVASWRHRGTPVLSASVEP